MLSEASIIGRTNLSSVLDYFFNILTGIFGLHNMYMLSITPSFLVIIFPSIMSRAVEPGYHFGSSLLRASTALDASLSAHHIEFSYRA